MKQLYCRLECVRCLFECGILSQVSALARVRDSGSVSVNFENKILPERPIRVNFPFLAKLSRAMTKRYNSDNTGSVKKSAITLYMVVMIIASHAVVWSRKKLGQQPSTAKMWNHIEKVSELKKRLDFDIKKKVLFVAVQCVTELFVLYSWARACVYECVPWYWYRLMPWSLKI